MLKLSGMKARTYTVEGKSVIFFAHGCAPWNVREGLKKG